jgi:hypothetical protein
MTGNENMHETFHCKETMNVTHCSVRIRPKLQNLKKQNQKTIDKKFTIFSNTSTELPQRMHDVMVDESRPLLMSLEVTVCGRMIVRSERTSPAKRHLLSRPNSEPFPSASVGRVVPL